VLCDEGEEGVVWWSAWVAEESGWYVPWKARGWYR